MDISVKKIVTYHLDLVEIDMKMLITCLKVASQTLPDSEESEWARSWWDELKAVRERAEA